MLRRCSVSLLLLTAAFSQTAAEWDGPRVHAIAQKLRCNCGCNLSMSCQMPPHPCPTCKRNRIRIYNMLSEGKSDLDIIGQYIAEEGTEVLWTTPGLAVKSAPYIALAFGLGGIVIILRRYVRAVPSRSASEEAVMKRFSKELAEWDQ